MKVLKTLVVLALVVSMTACTNQVANKKSLESNLDSISYALGLDMANKFKAGLPEVDKGLFMQGYVNGMDSVNLLIKNEDLQQVINTYFQKKQLADSKKQQVEAMEKAEKEYGAIKKESEDFLAKNKTKKGVVTTASGLQYEVIKKGTGAQPTATDKVKVHYTGTLIDGTVFDSSVEKGEPIVHPVNQFIKGWTEGLQLMHVGAKYKFYIPQDLAYGAFPRAGKIKPFSTLIFEVELLGIEK